MFESPARSGRIRRIDGPIRRWKVCRRSCLVLTVVIMGSGMVTGCMATGERRALLALEQSERRQFRSPPDSLNHPRLVVRPGNGSLPFVKGVVLVVFRDSSSLRSRAAAINAINGVIVGEDRVADESPLYTVVLPSHYPNTAAEAATKVLNDHPAVLAAVPNYIFVLSMGRNSRLPSNSDQLERSLRGTLGPPPDSLSSVRRIVQLAKDDMPFLKGVVLVTFRPGTSTELRAAAIQSVNGLIAGEDRRENMPPLFTIVLPPSSPDSAVLGATSILENHPAVLSALPNYIFRLGKGK